MILPIISYGSSVLKKTAKEITSDYPNLSELIANMWETMYAANGVGLAAPQIGLSLRIFVIDASPFVDEENMSVKEIETIKTFKKVFINPKIISEEGKLWDFNEGCLSIPGLRGYVERPRNIRVDYLDEDAKPKSIEIDEFLATVFQHEIDHLIGRLYVDRMKDITTLTYEDEMVLESAEN